MTERIFYLPVTLTSHNGGTGDHSYFVVQPVPREGSEPWPLTLSPDQMHLVYIHPSQLRTEAGERTLEQEIAEKHRERNPELYAAYRQQKTEP